MPVKPSKDSFDITVIQAGNARPLAIYRSSYIPQLYTWIIVNSADRKVTGVKVNYETGTAFVTVEYLP